MTMSLQLANPVRFHISLNVSNLEKSVQFYEILFGLAPAKRRTDYAKFEPSDPPLVVSLEPNGRVGGGTLNHLGIRLSDARQLVALQERLEKQGIRSQREEGVECCYAKQTKFWVQDPDQTLWEFYTLDDDELDHRGVGQSIEVMTSSTLPGEETVWEHKLGTEFPVRIDACDNTVDLVTLRGTFNAPLDASQQQAVLSEAKRVLKPSGRLLLRILSGTAQHPSPRIPGYEEIIKFVPAKDDVVSLLSQAGLEGIRLLKYEVTPCFTIDGIAMRETHIEAFRGSPR